VQQGPVELTDGSVIVPPALAGPVLRILVRDLAQHIRTDGGAPTAGVRQLVYALARAEHKAGRFATESVQPLRPTVECSTAEAAALLECSAQHVRSLVRSGRILGRRIGQRAWAINRASLDAWRHHRREPTVAKPDRRPGLADAIADRIAKQTGVLDPAAEAEQFTRVNELAKSNPAAYAELPQTLRVRAAMHATQPGTQESTEDAA
jgi:excisionase family DNA binding protein